MNEAPKPPRPALYRPNRAGPGVYVFDLAAAPWLETGRAGIRQKNLRLDDTKGLWLGYVSMAPEARSGLHQHRGTAVTYMLGGGFMDHSGGAPARHWTVNLPGATHDATVHETCWMLARLEGPTVYPEDFGALHTLHPGAHRAAFAPPAPDHRPQIVIDPAALRFAPAGIEGVKRRTIYDYAPSEVSCRLVELALAPGARIPAHRALGLTEWYVLAGQVATAGAITNAGGVVLTEPGAELVLASPYGARVFCWAEAPMAWSDGAARPDLYGF